MQKPNLLSGTVWRRLKKLYSDPWLFRTLLPGVKCHFVDCGGNNGSSVRMFRKDFDFHSRFYITSFEPNPRFFDCYSNFLRHKLVRAAVDNRDGHRQFFLDPDDGDGSTFFENKLTQENGGYGVIDVDRPVNVQTVNLSRWIDENIDQKDYLVLKLDVEGAEYDILEQMIADATIRKVRQLFIEWHYEKVSVPAERHHKVRKALVELKIPVRLWDAQITQSP